MFKLYRGYRKIFVYIVSSFLIVTFSACSEEKKSNVTSKPAKELTAAEGLYTKNCKVCHAQGINGAPILGNVKMWSDRASKGKATLVSHAVGGFGLMPAKGGKTHLSDQEIEQIVEYMLSQVPNK